MGLGDGRQLVGAAGSLWQKFAYSWVMRPAPRRDCTA